MSIHHGLEEKIERFGRTLRGAGVSRARQLDLDQKALLLTRNSTKYQSQLCSSSVPVAEVLAVVAEKGPAEVVAPQVLEQPGPVVPRRVLEAVEAAAAVEAAVVPLVSALSAAPPGG